MNSESLRSSGCVKAGKRRYRGYPQDWARGEVAWNVREKRERKGGRGKNRGSNRRGVTSRDEGYEVIFFTKLNRINF